MNSEAGLDGCGFAHEKKQWGFSLSSKFFSINMCFFLFSVSPDSLKLICETFVVVFYKCSDFQQQSLYQETKKKWA